MVIIDITVAEQGTQVNAIEELLVQTYNRVEKQHISVVERQPKATIMSRHAAIRFRIAAESKGGLGIPGLQDTVDRVRNRTGGAVRVDTDGARVTFASAPQPA